VPVRVYQGASNRRGTSNAFRKPDTPSHKAPGTSVLEPTPAWRSCRDALATALAQTLSTPQRRMRGSAPVLAAFSLVGDLLAALSGCVGSRSGLSMCTSACAPLRAHLCGSAAALYLFRELDMHDSIWEVVRTMRMNAMLLSTGEKQVPRKVSRIFGR